MLEEGKGSSSSARERSNLLLIDFTHSYPLRRPSCMMSQSQDSAGQGHLDQCGLVMQNTLSPLKTKPESSPGPSICFPCRCGHTERISFFCLQLLHVFLIGLWMLGGWAPLIGPIRTQDPTLIASFFSAHLTTASAHCCNLSNCLSYYRVI